MTDRERFRFLAAASGAVTALPAWLATEEEQARALDLFEQQRIVGELARRAERQVLVALWALASGTALRSPHDATPALVARVAAALSRGSLLLIAGWDDGRYDVVEDEGGGPAEPEARTSAPATTPSQAVAEQHWIEIEVVYDDGTPYDGDCTLVLPDGRESNGAPDAAGLIRLDGVAAGSCKLSLPGLDASAWSG